MHVFCGIRRAPEMFNFGALKPGVKGNNKRKARLHSSRMRTARLLTVPPSMHCTEGVSDPKREGVSTPGGVSGPGRGCLLTGGCLLSGGCLLLG